jgi:hypothetical protein
MMGKRFTCTGKWEDPWFMDLPIPEKLAYLFVLDRCDPVGVWKVNMQLLKFLTGYPHDADTLQQTLGENRVYQMANGKWWLTKFVDFQYGHLEEDTGSKPHRGYINLLKKHDLWKEYTKGIYTHKEKDQEKEKEKERDTLSDDPSQKLSFRDNVKLTREEYDKLVEKFGSGGADDRLDALSSYMHSKGKRYKSHYHTVLSWERMNGKEPKTQTEAAGFMRGRG